MYNYFKKISEIKNIKLFSENNNTLLNLKNLKQYYPHIKEYLDNPYILAPYRVPHINIDHFVEDIKKFCKTNCVIVAHIRNPIDILISSYYSFGFIHEEPDDEKEKVIFYQMRSIIQKTTIDEFCLKELDRIFEKLKAFYRIISDNPNVIISSYYEMKLDYKTWNDKMCSLMKLDSEQSTDIYELFETEFRIRPLDNSNVISGKTKRHIRNGSNLQYLTELKPETVDLLKQTLIRAIPKRLFEYPDFLDLKLQMKLLIVSHGGSATTTFMEFINRYIPTNCSRDLDGLKHTIPSKVEEYKFTHIIYIYGDMDKTMRSLFRRKAGETTIASIHEYKLKGIKHSRNLSANFEDFNKYTKFVTETSIEPVGCLVHMREWKKIPAVFFIHYEQICKSDTIDDYLDIPKGTCSHFTVVPRVSEIQACETPEYLETMKGLDLRVQKIITGHPHKTNIGIVAFPRSGLHLLKTIFQSYFSIKECGCHKNPLVKDITSVKEDIALHTSHDMDLTLEKQRFNKTIILYRKDTIESLDAFFRYQFRTFDIEQKLDGLSKHSSCHELDIPYSQKSDFFRMVLKHYNRWIQKWVTNETPNSILIEYSEFMKNPQETLDKLQDYLLQPKDSDLSAKIVEEIKIEYKHSLSVDKYKELANVLTSLT
jgi:hypothetical protein